jgi:hypothetical protein
MSNHELDKVSKGSQERLDPDLQAIVTATKDSPELRAKMARAAFAARDWPNEKHPGTVRDFLTANGIPTLDTTRQAPPISGLTPPVSGITTS